MIKLAFTESQRQKVEHACIFAIDALDSRFKDQGKIPTVSDIVDEAEATTKLENLTTAESLYCLRYLLEAVEHLEAPTTPQIEKIDPACTRQQNAVQSHPAPSQMKG